MKKEPPLPARALSSLLLTGVLSVAIASPARAAAGDLDPSFGEAGTTTTDFGAESSVNAIAVLPDGGLVVAGYAGKDPAEGETGADFAVARYAADGSIDSSFGDAGRARIDLGGHETAEAVAVQSDGRIVLAGMAQKHWVVARLTGPGGLDPSFGRDGIVRTGFGFTGHDTPQALAMQPDGRILVSGTVSLRYDGGTALVRYNPDGTLDRTFDGNGRSVTEGVFMGRFQRLAVFADGAIELAGGDSGDGQAPGTVGIMRADASGHPDRAFGVRGLAEISIPKLTNFEDASIAPDGSIAFAGNRPRINSRYASDFGVALVTAKGELDTSFSGDGARSIDISRTDNAWAVAIQRDGKIVVAGTAGGPDVPGLTGVARLNPDGSLDRTFSRDGKVNTGYRQSPTIPDQIALQPLGGIVAAGTACCVFAPDFAYSNVALSRYESA